LLSAGKDANVWKGNTSRVMVAIGLKVSFWPDGSTSPGNYGFFFVDVYYSFTLTNFFVLNFW
jgi:hypothetical protein